MLPSRLTAPMPRRTFAPHRGSGATTPS